MLYVGGEEHPRYVGCVGGEHSYGYEGRDVSILEHAPYVDVSLLWLVVGAEGGNLRLGRSTLLFPAQSIEPSLATLTLEMETPSSGMS